MRRRWRELALACLLLAPLAILPLLCPIPQDPRYHSLADTCTLLGIRNALNVLSNIPFLIIGLLGASECVRHPSNGATRSWFVFFAALALVCIGSAYYHWDPDDATLAWDRIPIAIATMALFSALVAEHVDARAEAVLPLGVVIAIASVVWWVYTDDVRLYVWAQFAPLVALLLMLALFPGRYSHRAYLGYALGCYVLAKVAELADHGIYELTAQAISGHTVKHLLAAAAAVFVWLMLQQRRL